MTSRTRRLLLVLLVAVAATAAVRSWLARPVPAPGPTSGPLPLSAAAYAEHLRREAGGPIDPAALAARARGVAQELEALLAIRARRLDPKAPDWRAVFARLRDDAPPSDAAVLEAYRAENEKAEAFCRERDLVPLPPTRPAVFAIENPTLRRLFPLAMNRGDGTLGITLQPPPAAGDERAEPAPPLYRRNHCWICIPPIAVHETYPGHHVAFALARPGQAGADSGRWPFFHEGWAQYAEVLLWEEGYWQGDAAREMGALHLMLLRATRAEVDARLHGGGLGADAARRLYVDRLLMDQDAARSEVSGHLQSPGKKASYLVGALQILALRDALPISRGSGLRPFHERLLSLPGPLPEIARERFGVAIPALPGRGLLAPATGIR